MSIISCVWNISWWVKGVKWLFGMDAGKMINLLYTVQSSLVYRRLTRKGISPSLSVMYMIVYIHQSLLWQELIACSGRREQLQTSWGLTRCSDSIIDLRINTEAGKKKKIKKQLSSSSSIPSIMIYDDIIFFLFTVKIWEEVQLMS